ncbi:MAG: MinD-like ATPase involved in chromosome partitioning or flagellar assembly [Mariniblastus sp.]|jgi:MinD-like ATPase involved in chromosome partitioning or flagellar assembly
MPVAVKKLQSSQPGKAYSFIGAKGGVGTTAVALCVATLLAWSNESVIAAEFQPFFGTFGQQLNNTPDG